jgi:hypothetical protein
MKKVTIQDDSDASLFYYPEIGAVHHVIKRFLEGDAFRNLMTRGADAFIEHGCTKWLADDRGLDAFRPEDLVWAGDNWQGRLRAAGWKHWAMILPDKVVGRVVAKKVAVRFIEAGLDVRTFEDEASALEWLASIED